MVLLMLSTGVAVVVFDVVATAGLSLHVKTHASFLDSEPLL